MSSQISEFTGIGGKKPLFLAFFLACSITVAAAQHDTAAAWKNDHTLARYVALGAGVNNILYPDTYFTLLLDVEVGIPVRIWIFYPVAGGFVTTRATTYLYGGIMLPVRLSRLVSVKGSIAAGYFVSGDDVQLNFPLEFYLSAEIALNLKNNYRLAFKYSHLSNGGLGNVNPGTEQISINLKIPY